MFVLIPFETYCVVVFLEGRNSFGPPIAAPRSHSYSHYSRATKYPLEETIEGITGLSGLVGWLVVGMNGRVRWFDNRDEATAT